MRDVSDDIPPCPTPPNACTETTEHRNRCAAVLGPSCTSIANPDTVQCPSRPPLRLAPGILTRFSHVDLPGIRVSIVVFSLLASGYTKAWEKQLRGRDRFGRSSATHGASPAYTAAARSSLAQQDFYSCRQLVRVGGRFPRT